MQNQILTPQQVWQNVQELFAISSAKISITQSQQANTDMEGHVTIHVFKDQKMKDKSFFQKFIDIRRRFNTSSNKWEKIQEAADFSWNPNRKSFKIYYDSKLQGRNEKGLKLDYAAVQWVFQRNNQGQWIVATAFPTNA